MTAYLPPGGFGVRVDGYVYPGYTIPPHYDSLIAKVITWGSDRAEAISRMKRALGEFTIEGVTTTIPFLLGILDDAAFLRGEVSTAFLSKRRLA